MTRTTITIKEHLIKRRTHTLKKSFQSHPSPALIPPPFLSVSVPLLLSFDISLSSDTSSSHTHTHLWCTKTDKYTGSGSNFHDFSVSDSHCLLALRLHGIYQSDMENAGMSVSSRDRFILTRDRDPIPCSLRAHNQ